MQQPHNLSDGNDDVAREFRAYVYSVSHDVGAPVRAMVEFSRLLTDEYAKNLDEDGRLYLSLIVENGRKLQTMMDGLLVYSRLTTEAQAMAPVDCMMSVRSVLAVLSDAIRESGAQIDCESLPDVEGDAKQVGQLFRVLLDNALKFQLPNNPPRIAITAEAQGAFWKFTVADNGIGIEERFQKQIFQMFQRLHTEEDFPGIGLGLSIAQKIVRRHGGEIWVESDADIGSRFMFTLPASPQKVSPSTPS